MHLAPDLQYTVHAKANWKLEFKIKHKNQSDSAVGWSVEFFFDRTE